MKNYPYYLYISIGYILLYCSVVIIVAPSITRVHLENVLSRDIEAAQHEAMILKSMSEGIMDNPAKTQITERIQKSITATDSQIIFNSILDWSGKYVCYPNKKEIGKIPVQSNALQLEPQEELDGEILRKFVYANKSKQTTSSIILLTPVPDSDWIIGSHLNNARVLREAASYKSRLYTSLAIIGLITLLFILISLGIVGRYYQKLLDLKSSQLEDGVLNLSKLNASLENYQKSLTQNLNTIQDNKAAKQEEDQEEDQENKTDDASPSKSTKQRIITYVRNEILSISTGDISHIYVENTITYVVRKDGKRSTTGESLDLIYSYLDPRFFFRVNRQIIVAISAIETITKFGNSKLKIQVNPESDIDIIIGKNKAAAFKQWLDL